MSLKFFLKKFFNGVLAVFVILNKILRHTFFKLFFFIFILQNCIDYLKLLHYSFPSLQFVHHFFIFPVFFKTN
ncbi:unnamed protein product [Meloidogyne enterolobii]|uniref:Uncharacterized protein n=1 Tax=Meloidogyne enterolobii TaxID=390850 RepID=A0ACB0ZUE8_MELEN